MKQRLRGVLHDFLDHLALLSENPRTDPVYVLAEHDLTDVRTTRYWADLVRIAEAHEQCNVPLHVIIPEVPPVERCPLHATAVYTRTTKEQRINLILTDGECSVEGSLILSRFGLKTVLGKQRTPPHPDCGPPGWIEGQSDVKNTVAIITKPNIHPAVAELLEDIPVDVYGVGMPGTASVALLNKYGRVLYLDDLDPCGIKRYLEWKKAVSAEYVGVRANWLQGVDFRELKTNNCDQLALIKDESAPPGLQEELRFLESGHIAELEEALTNMPGKIVDAVRAALGKCGVNK